MILIGKIFSFSASHRLSKSEWTDEKNLSVFGKCANPNGHGHNYLLEVTVQGPLQAETGMVMDASTLSMLVEKFVTSQLDHKNLDLDVDWLHGVISTSENVVNAIWQRLEEPISKVGEARLYEIKLWETSKIYALKRAV